MPDDDRRSVGVRVRPNSHDFIRQLRQDLAAKRYTYDVNVGAKTTQATKDVRAWAAGPLKAINAVVNVRANTGPATRDMAEWRRRQGDIGTTVKVHADTSAAVREIQQLQAMAKDVTVRVNAETRRARAATRNIKVNEGAGGDSGMLNLAAEKRALQRFARNVDEFVRSQRPFQGVGDSLTREISDALDKGLKKAKPKVDVDTSPARKSMRELLDQVNDGAKRRQIKVELEVDDEFDYKLRRRLRNVEAKLKADPIKTALEVETEGLERQILALKIQEKARKLNLPIQYDPTDVKQMRGELALLRLREEANEIKLRVNVSRSSLEQAKSAMDSVGKQFGNFNLIRSLDVGPFNLGKPSGLVGTVSTLTILAGLLPGAVAGATALADGLTRMAAAAALVPGAIGALAASLATLSVGTKGVGDAFSTMFAMWDEGASQQGKSATRLIGAQNNYKNAVVDETRAQERVATARRQALGELRNLNIELRGGVLNEAQALLDLQKARDRYAQGGFENETERLQAQLDIQSAELNVSKSREDNINLQQKANDANAKGVEGSDLVRDALDGQRRAADATAQALEALSAGGAGATTAAQKFQDQLAQLSPNAQDFVLTIAGFKDEMYGFRNAIQDTIFQGAGPAFADMFDDLLPVVQPGMEKIAQGLNSNLLQVFDTIKSPAGETIIERILGGTADTQKALSGLIDPLIRGVGTLVAAGTEHMPQVIELFTKLADRFATFIDKADKDGTLDEFLDKGVGALADMAEIGLNLIKIVNDLSKAFGGNILTDISNITTKWHEFLSSEEGQAKLKEFLEEARDLWAEWKPVIMQIPDAFAAVSDAAQTVLGFLLPTIENILGFLDKFPGAIEAIATALILSKLLGSFSTLATTIGGIWKALSGLPSLINKIPGVNIPGLPTPGDPKGKPGAKGGLGGVGGFLTANPGVVAAAAPAILLPALADTANTAVQAQPGQEDINSVNAQLPKDIKPVAGTNKDANMLLALKNLADKGDPLAKWILEKAPPTDPNVPGLPFSGSMLLDPAAELDVAKRYLWAMQHPEAGAGGAFTPPPSYMSGGYTDWGSKSGRVIEAHGGEYIEPKPTVDHYGVDAMRAVHEKRANISYDTGGSVPLAYPGIDRVPYGGAYGPRLGGGLGWYVPGAHGIIPGAAGDTGLGPGASPWRGKVPKAPKGKYPWRDKRRGVGGLASFAEGGELVFDPVTGQFVQTGAAVSHGVAPDQGPGIIGTLATNIPSGISNVASAATAPAGSADAAVSPFGVTGAAPGPAADAATGTPGFGNFGNSFLSGLGIPGLGGDQSQQDSGPGWGEGGPPIGLGGGPPGPNGEAPFDIRKFGIGPGPMGSGPNDWQKFAGKEIGKFGSSLISTFATGLLGSLGISGLSQNITAMSPLLDHFFGEGAGKAQGEGAGQTNSDVASLLATEGSMAGNPAYPGVGTLPDVFDPATGSAVGAGKGLQSKTAIGENAIRARFPWATNIGGVRKDALKWHPQGLALDVMTDPGHDNNDPSSPEGLAKGNQLVAWIKANQKALGIDYWLWQEKDHYNHVHVNFSPSGYGPGTTPSDLTPVPNGNWANWKPAAPKAAPKAAPPRNTTPAPGTPLGDLFLGSHYVGGPVPLADPNWEMQDPKFPAAKGRYEGSAEAIWGDDMMPIGTYPWQGFQGGRAGPGPGGMNPDDGINPGFTAPPAWAPGDGGWFRGGKGKGKLRQKVMDQGGILRPGTTLVHNYTNKDELVVPSFAYGGLNTAYIPRPRPQDKNAGKAQPPPPPMPPVAPPPGPAALPPAQAVPGTPPPKPVGVAPQGQPPVGPAVPPPPEQVGPSGAPVAPSSRPATGVGPDAKAGTHTHPALATGITSGFAAAGKAASAAASMGMGGMGGGAMGGFIEGLFGQAGKIANGVANVASSFLVGNITGGTTENPYGVTQRGSVPSGGTRTVDASNNQYGDVYTNNLDEYFKQMERKENQHAQANLGRWGTQV